jgi:putative spermidine/putrescine transport system ATP-binding protein
MSRIELQKISKSYDSFVAVQETSLAVEQGEFFSLLGPSGCGKSTLLRLISGFVEPTTGRILIGPTDVTALPPERRQVGIVFQNYAIFPHMTVADNVAYGLKLRRVPADIRRRKVAEALERVSLAGLEGRMPSQLSGGQLQRVAIARVIVIEPRLLLLDEPLSALDRKLREEMGVWFKALQKELGVTTIYVTHDQDEALYLSDRIGVMNRGIVEQIGTTAEIYEAPRTAFVAGFIGRSNILSGRIESVSGETVALALGSGQKIAGRIPRALTPPVSGASGALMIRPENVLIGPAAEAAPVRLSGTVREVGYLGSTLRYVVQLGLDLEITAEQVNHGAAVLPPGAAVDLGWHPGGAVLLSDAGRHW